jgi:hypothetical protein
MSVGMMNNPAKGFPIIVMKGLLLLITPAIIFTSGCARKIYDIAYPTLNDGQYDSEFPYKECSKQLEEMFHSIFRISHMAYYETFVFSENHPVTYAEVIEKIPTNQAVEKRHENRGSAGTATVIYRSNNHVAFLTCAHVVAKPETLFTFFQEGDVRAESSVQSISIKRREVIFVPGEDRLGELEILATDHEQDIAVIGKGGLEDVLKPPAFKYPIGHSEELEWGDFVYVLGYPIGHQMVTRGIVSQPNMIRKKGCFLIDVNFNKGFSGGVVIAVRDGVPNFELVGIAKSVSAGTEYVLRPEKEVGQYQYDAAIPYKGQAFVRTKTEINYGVTHVICIEAIRKFFEKNRKSFVERGYFFDELFK